MEIGLAFTDGELSWDEQADIAREAARLGYASIWAQSGLRRDAFIQCTLWARASAEVVHGGLGTGTCVVPVPLWSPLSLASLAATVADVTGGRFVLGIGAGGVGNAGYRRVHGVPDVPAPELVRDYITVLKGLLAGAAVDHDGRAFTLRGAQLRFRPPHVPVYLGALGPRLLRSAGALADGVMLSWTSPRHTAWSRERVAEGAVEAGRDPSSVRVVGYVRVCLDDDAEVARGAIARQFETYRGLRSGYDRHFSRIFSGAAGAEALEEVAYFGPAGGAATAVSRLAAGMDVAIVRVIVARPDRPHVDQVLATVRACAPSLLAGPRVAGPGELAV